jgi:hypothetical protein
MNLTVTRDKKFTYATVALYILGWILGSDHIIWALLSFGGSAVCAFGTIPLEAKDKKSEKVAICFLIAVTILPALGALWTGYQGSADENKFRNYLAEHQCKYVGSTITGYSKGGCDRFGSCEDPQEIEESEYFCAATKKRITYTNFRAGHYGQ